MVFDIGAGLSEMGKSVAQTAQAYTLESQKAALEEQKVRLADELAGAREEKGRQFTTSERLSTQQFTSGENKENRSNALAIANISADAAVKSAGIHAGGTVAAANISATSHLAGIDKQLAQNKPLIDAEALTKSIANANSQMVQDARREITEARASGDPKRIQAAQQKEYDATYSSQAQVQQVSLYQSQAKIAESAMNHIQGKIASLQASPMAMTPETKATIDQLKAQLKVRESEFNAALRTADDAIKNLPAYSPPVAGTAAPGAGVIQYDAKGNRVTTPPTAAPARSPGLIDQPASP